MKFCGVCGNQLQGKTLKKRYDSCPECEGEEEVTLIQGLRINELVAQGYKLEGPKTPRIGGSSLLRKPDGHLVEVRPDGTVIEDPFTIGGNQDSTG